MNYFFNGFYSVCVYGGGSRKGQIQVVQKGVEIVIGEFCIQNVKELTKVIQFVKQTVWNNLYQCHWMYNVVKDSRILFCCCCKVYCCSLLALQHFQK